MNGNCGFERHPNSKTYENYPFAPKKIIRFGYYSRQNKKSMFLSDNRFAPNLPM